MFQKLYQRYNYSYILLRQLVITDFKLRYQGSLLGYVWSLLRPLAIFVILYFVFTKAFPISGNVEHYPVLLLIGVLLWNYYSEVTNTGVSAIVGKGDLLRKINFPKYIVVLAGSLSAFINLMITAVVVAGFMIFNKVDLQSTIIWVPLIIFELFVLALSLAFLLSALFVKLRDINYVWEVIMQGAFYATPVIYDISFLPHKFQQILILNPIAQIIQDLRHSLVTDTSPTISTVYGNEWMRLVPVGIVLLLAFFSMWYFRKRSRYFAEEI